MPGYAATMFSLLGISAGMYAAARITAAGADEISRHTVLLFGLPVSRRQLAGAEILVTVARVLLLLTSAGVAVWVGTAAAGAPLDVGAALTGALNVTPVALLCLGGGAGAGLGSEGGTRRRRAARGGRIPAASGDAERRGTRVGWSALPVCTPGLGPRDTTGLGGNGRAVGGGHCTDDHRCLRLRPPRSRPLTRRPSAVAEALTELTGDAALVWPARRGVTPTVP